jgi:hypothetical protein
MRPIDDLVREPSRRAVRGRTTMTLLLAATAALGLVACTNDGPAEDEADPESALDLPNDVIGRCLLFDDDAGPDVYELPYIACDQAHTHQIFHVFDDDNDVYPGFEALESSARVKCLDAFDDFVGRNPFDSILFYTWLVPSFDSWNDTADPDRTTICLLGPRDSSRLFESMEGKNV